MNSFLHSSIGSRALWVFAVLAISWQFAAAQPQRIELKSESSRSQVVSNDMRSTEIGLSFQALDVLNVKTNQGDFTELILPEGFSTGDLGNPKLPASKHLIEIPFGAEVEVIVKSYTSTEYRLADYGISQPLMPVQPSLRKDQDPEKIPFEFRAQAYQKAGYIEPEMAQVEVLGVMRGMRLARLTVSPVSYNPVEGTLRVANDIELEIRYTGADQALTNYIKASTWSPWFEVLYSQVLNPFNTRNAFDDHPDLTKNPVKMVIVSHRSFEETLQPFIEWQTQKGFFVTVAYTDEIGTTPAAIQSYVHAQYNAGTPDDPAPTFLIVVGDNTTLPASAIGSSSNSVTDLYYASVDGDYFPEMYYGRLSARNTQELQNQIDKILYYQRYEFDDPSYLNDVTLIAGQDGTWNPRIGQPTVHYGTQNYFNTAHGFVNVNAYLTSYTGCYDEARIATSMINFTAHCSPTSWAGPYLTVADVHNMTNAGRYPLAVGNCCQSSLFSHTESIGEAWVRAANKGAVAYVGSAPNTYWFEDFYWAVGAFPLQGTNNGYVPTVEETTLGAYDAHFVSDYLAVASLKFVGNLAVTVVDQQNYPSHSSPLYYWQAYHTFGDPSTVIYYTEGTENEVSHLPILPIGLDTYTVEAEPGSYVAISKDGVLHGAAFVDASGEVEVPIEPVMDGGDVMLVVTRPQRIPYIATIPAAALEGPFVVLGEYDINDTQGNNNQVAEYGETISLHVTLKNVGADPVGQVKASLTGTDPYVSILNAGAEVSFSGMQPGETGNTSTVQNAFSLEVSQDVPNQHQATFQLTVTEVANPTNQWVSNLRINAYAPVFVINPVFNLDDSQGGDGNGRLDPGETAVISFTLTNNGQATANAPEFEIAGFSAYLSIDEQQLELDPIAGGQSIQVPFVVHAHPATPQGTFVDLLTQVEDGHMAEASSQIVIGQVPEAVLGEGNATSNQYPFYNYYKANRSQMLYLASELGAGEKTITEIGFNITRPGSQYNALPNFKILIKPTTMTQVPSAFTDMSDATEVFSAAVYTMPTVNGWHSWEIEHFEYDGESNLLIEIVWGQLANWTSTFYQVASTVMPNNMVAYGFSDTMIVPNFNGVSSTRPNLYIAFAAEATADAQAVTFVTTDENNQPLSGVAIKVGSMVQHTGTEGQTVYELLPGEYSFMASLAGQSPVYDSFTVSDSPLTIPVSFDARYDVHFHIFCEYGPAIDDAIIHINGEAHAPGEYEMTNMPGGSYNYTVVRDGYFDYTGSFELTDHNIDIEVILEADGTSVSGPAGDSFAVQLFPNPALDMVHVRLQNAPGKAVVDLMNYQGQLMRRTESSDSAFTQTLRIPLGGLSAGVYYIRVTAGEQQRIDKLIIQ